MTESDSRVKARAIRATACRIKGHQWEKDHLYRYPRPGGVPGLESHRVCERCGELPDCTEHCDIDTDGDTE